MKHGADTQVVFEVPENGLDFDEQHIHLPGLLGLARHEVAPQEIVTVIELNLLELLFIQFKAKVSSLWFLSFGR